MKKVENERDLQYKQTHKLIFKTAMKLFTTKSFEKVTIREICKECKISIGSFYHHYSSKEEILNQGYHQFDHITEENIKNKTFHNAEEKLYYLLSLELSAMEESGYYSSTQYFKNQLTMSEPYILDENRFFYVELKNTLKEYIKEKKMEIDAEELTQEVLRISRGTIYDWCLHKGSYPLVSTALSSIKHILSYHLNK